MSAMYSIPNVHIQERTLQMKIAVRPPRNGKEAPPCAFTNSKFGQYYVKTPNFERDNEQALMNDEDGFGSGWGYKHGTRFRAAQAKEGQMTTKSKLKGKSARDTAAKTVRKSHSRSVSVPVTVYEHNLIAPLNHIPLYWQTRPLPKDGPQKEMVHKRTDGLEKSPFGWYIYHDGSYGHCTKERSSIPARESTSSQLEDEMQEMNDSLDSLYAYYLEIE